MESLLDNMQDMERHPKLREQMKKKGQKKVVTFVTNDKVVSEDAVKNALQRKNIENIKAKRSLVIVAEDDKGEKFEIWHTETDFTVLKQLKTIKDANGGSLVGARVRVTRLAVNDPHTTNWQYQMDEKGAEA